MIKLTNETLRAWYLMDLELPDIHHGRTTAKVRYPERWKKITSWYKSGPIDLTGRKIWAWSDTHFGHKNIIEYGNRPFDDVGAMQYAMVRDYCSLVQPDDVVFWVGDISFRGRNETNEILDSLPGYKIQVVGNHDMDRSGKLSEYNFDERHICCVVDVGRVQLLFTHYPLDNVPKGAVNVHGHIHQNVANPWNINVSVEHTNYAPISLDAIMVQANDYFETK